MMVNGSAPIGMVLGFKFGWMELHILVTGFTIRLMGRVFSDIQMVISLKVPG